jgi:uncharacterized protein YjbJ (UPF0337 family)
MAESNVASAARNVGGKVQQIAGQTKSEVEGKVEEIAGVAGELYDHAKDAAQEAVNVVKKHAGPMDDILRKTIEESPYTAVFLALCLGWFVGHVGRTR